MVAFIVTVQLVENKAYSSLGIEIVAMRITQYSTVETRLKTIYSSHPKKPSQPVDSWAAATSAGAVFMASAIGWTVDMSQAPASVEETLLATCAPFDKSDAMVVNAVASYVAALCEAAREGGPAGAKTTQNAEVQVWKMKGWMEAGKKGRE